MKGNSDYSSRFRILKGGKISLVVSALLAGSSIAYAAPSGGTVTTGSATISQNGSVTTISQSTNKASINWQDFSIGKSETVNFVQPSAASVTLNRVIGTNRSLIEGAMNANGQVLLLNPNGVLFSKEATVNVGGLVASTLNITDANFQAGNYVFEGNSQNSIINMGTITAANGGYVAMMGKTVQNEGTVVATVGNVQMASGEKISLNLNGNSLVKLTIDKGTMDALVENKGLIRADGGQVYLTTQALNTILDGMVNNTGIIEAQSIDDLKAEVILFAHGGTANIGGTIKAEGGFVETSGDKVKVSDAFRVQAQTWLIDPTDFTIAASGGDITGATLSANLGGSDVIIQSTSGGSGTSGNINVNDAITWNAATKLTLEAQNNININEDITIENVGGELALHYGQGSVYANNTSDYILSGTIQTVDSDDFEVVSPGNIIFTAGGKLTEKKGSNGPAITSNFKDVAYVTKEVVSDISDDSIQDDGVQGPITWTIRPVDTHMIAVKPTSTTYDIDDVSTLFAMTQESKDYINGVFSDGTTNFAVAYQDITLTAGQTLTTAWNYTSTDYDPYNDGSFLSFVNTSNSNDHTSAIYGLNTEAMVLGATVEGTGNWSTKSYGSTGWQTASFKAGQAGTYRIGYAVFNLGDTSLSPFLVLDTEAGTVLKNGVNFEPLAVDPNGPLAQAGITITVPSPTPTPTPASEPTPTPTPSTEQQQQVNNVVTTIVNSTTVTPPAPIVVAPVVPQQQVQTLAQNNFLLQSILPQGSGSSGSFALVGSTDGTSAVQTVTMEQLQNAATTQGMGEIRVPLANNSLVELVNGGLNLPAGVTQEFYVVDNSANSGRAQNVGQEDQDKKTKKN